MRRVFAAVTLLTFLLVCVIGAAQAETFLRVRNGDVISSRIRLRGEVEKYRVFAPDGVGLRVRAVSVAGGPSLALKFLDGDGITLREGDTGRSLAMTLPPGGRAVSRIEVAAADAVSTGGYRLTVSWVTPQPPPQTLELVGVGQPARMVFRGWAGDTASISVRPAPGSKARPTLNWLNGPDDGTSAYLQARRRATVELPETSDYEVVIHNRAADDGDVTVSVRLQSARRRLDLRGVGLPAGAVVLDAASVAPGRTTRISGDSFARRLVTNGATTYEYGSVSLRDYAVVVAPGTVRRPTTLVLAAARDLWEPHGLTPAGPAMFVGTAGLPLRQGRTVNITLDIRRHPPAGTLPRVLFCAGDFDPEIEVNPDDLDYDPLHGVTFAASPPATFQAFVPEPPRLGVAVAASEDLLAIGSPLEAVGPHASAGVVRIYARNGASWAEEARLQLADAADDDRFGEAVALSGDTLVVGAPRRADAGAAYVYVRSPDRQWVLQSVLLPAAETGTFGEAVAVDGGTAVVGSPLHDGGRGATYVFDRTQDTWTESARLTDPDVYQLGTAVAISGSTLLAGTNRDHDVRVHARTGSTWVEQGRLTPSWGHLPGEAGDGGGGLSAVALDGDVAVVSSTQDAAGLGGASGVAWVFTRTGTTWSERRVLHPADAYIGTLRFGESVAVRGGRILVGAPFFAESGRSAWRARGAGYLFGGEQQGFALLAVLGADEGSLNDDFGTSVALSPSGITAVVGSPYVVVGASAVGQAYVVDVP